MSSLKVVPRGDAACSRPEQVLPARAAAAARPKPHLCFVAPHAWPVFSRDPRIQVVGGAEVQQAILARLFAANGYRVTMICLDYGQPDRTVVDGVTVRKAYRADAGVPVLRYLHPRLTTMWRLMREVDADIYYYRSTSMWAGIMSEFCRRHGKRCVYGGASDRDFLPGGGDQIRYARDRWIYDRGIRRVDRIVVQNPTQLETLREHFGRDAALIPSCYEPPAPTWKGERDIVLWVGTLHHNKRPQLLLEVARRLPQRRFVMIGGPGADKAFFEAMRREAATLPNLEFTGFLPLAQVEPWFDRARVLALTSLYEGMPNVFLQAWARGVPTVGTVDVRVPAHRSVPDVEALAAEVERLMTDGFAWRSASAACRRHFERTHSTAHVLEQYERIFAELAP